MMATYARRVDALGGTDRDKSEEWNEGYGAALAAVDEIVSEADDVIAELVETLTDILDGSTGSLMRWSEQAKVLITSVEWRTRQ